MNTFDVEYQSFKLPSSILKDSILFVRRDFQVGEKTIVFCVGEVRYELTGPIVPCVLITKDFKKMVLA